MVESLITRLESERLILEPFREDYITNTYIGWLNNNKVTQYTKHRYKINTHESCLEYFARMRDLSNPYYAVILKQDPQLHVGNISALIDYDNKVADMGILIGESQVWGNGVGAEAWVLLMNHLMSSGGVRKITAGAMAINTGMLGIMRKAGMHEECIKARQFLFDSKEVDAVQVYRFSDEGPVAIESKKR